MLRENSNVEAFPEVLVPPDQEALLARYVEQLRNHKHVQLMAELQDTPLEPLELTPIQIAPLDASNYWRNLNGVGKTALMAELYSERSLMLAFRLTKLRCGDTSAAGHQAEAAGLMRTS